MRFQKYWLFAALGIMSVAMFVASGCGPGKSNGSKSNAPAEKDADVVADTDAGDSDAVALTDAEMEKGKDIFFDRCAGCHGVLRKGATGPSLEPDVLKEGNKTTAFLKAIIHAGTPAGMPEWGLSGILTPDEVDLMARYIQAPVPEPVEWSLEDMKGTHKVYIPVKDRPTAPPAGKNWENYFGVILRDVGKVALIDGDTKEMIKIIETGFAVHILRTSASGRYMYSIGRDGRVTMIDLWMETPDKVAEVKACNDARSIDTSKYKGPEGDFLDRYVIVGGYWPPAGIILKGDTLEPLKMFSTSAYEIDKGEFVREARVAAIVADHHNPSWVLNIKEAGQIWLVDYSKLGDGDGTISIDMIKAERFLHDGGWDSTKRYFLVAANARDKVSVIDTKTQTLVKNIPTGGTKPHPGRGANFNSPEYGPMWITGHIASNHIAFIGTDPEGHPDNAWRVVKTLQLPGNGGGNLFVKTHPNSRNIWADRTVNPDKILADSVFVINKDDLDQKIRQITIPEKYRGKKAVHLEYNKAGTEVWVSVWGKKDGTGAILVYDDKTGDLIKEITGDWCVTPTGHFNVYNTTHDIY